ncbi:hypothetical protein PUNSTDRAFT_131623 [Punctularia strigosozonata HHB-11173 SS5]|uniref:uncharacterized protein n=1 Tax=Punctularia strigosozonata (strain HHB-11173) TaxID=741275 RepID=UPI0004417FEF|nr:uncharacterized protein PUNSTDRAFT_131623 [Punctularia strigosozonata HHB-11173 SS5]EIN11457.1 hypothetical protein PUNSTDRAFT_131623 [Punctularia strigosozonata HHB-11173 SS5]
MSGVSPVNDPAEETPMDEDETSADVLPLTSSPTDLPPACSSDQTVRRNSRFLIPDGNLQIIVAGTEYLVHRSIFMRESEFFRSRVCTQCSSSHAVPVICLSDVDCNDFDLFLDIIYPRDYNKRMAETLADWTAVLHLSDMWGFRTIRELAMRKCFPLALPVDKIVLGRRYDIKGWLKDAYVAICQREEPLTLQEGKRLHLEDVIAISEVRQSIRDAKMLAPAETVVSTVVRAFSSRLPAEESSEPAPSTSVPRENEAGDSKKSTKAKDLRRR